jgi:lysozyme family protein
VPEVKLPDPVAVANPPEDEPDKPLSKAKDYASLQDEYARLYRKLSVRTERSDAVEWHLAMIRKSKARYQSVGEQTGVPWYFIAVTHGLEASFNFRAHLHNGDFPLSSRTRQVPAGRPTKWLPPSDWESSARDALRLLGFTGQKDWSLTRTLYRLEAYNGFGYRSYGVPTPYLWSFSNHYDRGKYVADGKFSFSARSQQCGAAVMLKMLAEAGELVWPTAPL